jgi:hypothetical protein
MLMTVKVTIDMPTTNAAAPMMPKIPAMTIPLEVTVDSISTNGDIGYTAVIGEVGLVEDTNTSPQVAQAAKTAFAGIKGSIAGVESSRGLNKKVEAKMPANADLVTKQIFELIKGAMTSPALMLPEEAIGNGAKWEAKTPVKSQGSYITPTTSYELTSVDGDHAKANYALTVDSSNPKVASAGLGNAAGTVELDLSKLMALQTTVNMHIDSPATKQQPNGAKMEINLVIEAK